MEGDKTLSCTDCGNGFIWTEGEQEFYTLNKLADPKRCPACRKARKVWREGKK